MRKPTWWDLGIAVLGLVLVCSAAPSGAQPQETGGTESATQGSALAGQGTGTGGSGQTADRGQGTGGTATGQVADANAQQLEIARLRAEVARLQEELARMRARPGPAGAEQGVGGAGSAGTEEGREGVGGAGSAGIGDPNAEAPAGASGLGEVSGEGVGGGGRVGGTGGARAAQPDTDNEGTAVANIIHTGRVRSVSSQELVLVHEGGGSSRLPLARDVRVLRGREKVSLQSLREGTFVRASADLYARGNPVTMIQVLPSSAAPSESRGQE